MLCWLIIFCIANSNMRITCIFDRNVILKCGHFFTLPRRVWSLDNCFILSITVQFYCPSCSVEWPILDFLLGIIFSNGIMTFDGVKIVKWGINVGRIMCMINRYNLHNKFSMIWIMELDAIKHFANKNGRRGRVLY